MKYYVIFYCASAYLQYLNACDGMSDIALSFPAMLIGVMDDDFISSCRSARNRISLDACIYVKVIPLYVYATADVL